MSKTEKYCTWEIVDFYYFGKYAASFDDVILRVGCTGKELEADLIGLPTLKEKNDSTESYDTGTKYFLEISTDYKFCPYCGRSLRILSIPLHY